MKIKGKPSKSQENYYDSLKAKYKKRQGWLNTFGQYCIKAIKCRKQWRSEAITKLMLMPGKEAYVVA